MKGGGGSREGRGMLLAYAQRGVLQNPTLHSQRAHRTQNRLGAGKEGL